MTESEKAFIISSIQRSIEHLQRIQEDIRTESDDRGIQQYLREGQATAESLRWEFNGRIRAMERFFKEKYSKK